MSTEADDRITRDDIEAQLRTVHDGFTERATKAKGTLIPAGIVGVLLLLLIAYLLGRRVGKAKSTFLEIRRI